MNELDARKPAGLGVVFRVRGELRFVPATIAMKVMPVPEMARVPGAPRALRGVALVDGNMIPVVDVVVATSSDPEAGSYDGAQGGSKRAMLVCAVLGETLGLVGIEIVATGRFEPGGAPGDVRLGADTARPFDVAALVTRVRESRWE